jgi:hypothetical protein
VGRGFTVIIALLIVEDVEYNIVVVPATKPVTTPVDETLATIVFELDHVPPETIFDSAVVLPTQTEYNPRISEPAVAFTNKNFVAVLVPQ